MSALTPLLNMDDNMSLGTPNFFNSAWNSEQSDYSFTESFQSSIGNYANYGLQLQQGQVEDNHLDYFSGPPKAEFSNQSVYQAEYGSGISQSHDDPDRILSASESSLLDKGIAAARPESLFNTLSQAARTQGIASYNSSVNFSSTGVDGLSLNDWHPKTKLASTGRLKTELVNDTGRRTSLRYGQITPVNSPLEDSLSPTQRGAKTIKSDTKHDNSSGTLKVKRPRKFKKKPMTKEQEEAKRKKFLERNRVAADKCRQNRKKWIDDLQTKAHLFDIDNTTKKAKLEELEQEVVQLKSLLFLHSRACDDKDIVAWIEQESSRVQQLSRAESSQPDDGMFSLSKVEASSSISRPPSTRRYGSVSDAVSRRYSMVTAGDEDMSSPTSSVPSY